MAGLQEWFVVYTENGVGVQVFRCMAEDFEHADEQCENAYPEANILWAGTGSAESVLQEWGGE